MFSFWLSAAEGDFSSFEQQFVTKMAKKRSKSEKIVIKKKNKETKTVQTN